MQINKQKQSFIKKSFLVLSMLVVVGIASYLFYESGFSLEVNLNGEVIAYVKKNEVVEEALEFVESDVIEVYGEDAYFEKELLINRVRGHKEDEIEANLLNQTILELIEVYKPASVIVVDKKDAVAVGTDRVAKEVLEKLKLPYQKINDESMVLDVYFSQEVEIVVKDVLVDNILPYDLALLPFIGAGEQSKPYKVANGDSVATITPLSNLKDDNPIVINLDKDVKSPKPGKEGNLANDHIQLDVVSVLEEKHIISIDFKTIKEDDGSLYTGNTKLVKAGKNGEKEITNKVTYVNGKENNKVKIKEEVLNEPTDKIVAIGTKQRPYYGQRHSSGLAAQIVNEAYVHVNKRVPYVFGGSSPSGFDCSGLTRYVYGRFGISLPHSATAQASFGVPVSKANLQPGDLVFFNRTADGRIGHVGIYIGGGNMIHAPVPGTTVSVTSINGSYFSSNFVTARRIP